MAPFRFLVVNAVVDDSAVMSPMDAATTLSAYQTGGVYDGTLMKMSDLSYADLDNYTQDSLASIETLAAHREGPSGIWKQVQYINDHDWHTSYAQADVSFFSDLSDWRIIATGNQATRVGFYAVAYQRGNTVVIAFRGTDDVSDLMSDAGIYLEVPNWIDQLQPASAFVEKIRDSLPSGNYNVIFTGHSMGGWLAQRMYTAYLSKYSNWSVAGATVFDSIGTGFHSDVSSAAHVRDYHFQGDIFSHYGSSLGQEIEIKNPTPDASIYAKHQMYDFYPFFYPSPETSKDVVVADKRVSRENSRV